MGRLLLLVFYYCYNNRGTFLFNISTDLWFSSRVHRDIQNRHILCSFLILVIVLLHKYFCWPDPIFEPSSSRLVKENPRIMPAPFVCFATVQVSPVHLAECSIPWERGVLKSLLALDKILVIVLKYKS